MATKIRIYYEMKASAILLGYKENCHDWTLYEQALVAKQLPLSIMTTKVYALGTKGSDLRNGGQGARLSPCTSDNPAAS
jgi:hypothetical protein